LGKSHSDKERSVTAKRFIPAFSEKRRTTLLLVSIAATLCFSQTALTQSGRHRHKSVSAPQPTVTAGPATDAQPVKPSAQVSSVIVVAEIAHKFDYFRSNYLGAVFKDFKDRITRRPSPAIEVTNGGSMSLNEARERAKKETETYLLWIEFVMQDNDVGAMSIAFINYAVLMPQTAKFLTWGKIYPGQESIRSAGGVLRVPALPGRNSALLQMREGTREIADRLIVGGWF
jgi:hypothetical protein